MSVIALAGKGGTGKTTVAALLVRHLVRLGTVLAIDADPSSNLNLVLGLPLTTTVGDIREQMLAGVQSGSVGTGITRHDFLNAQIRLAGGLRPAATTAPSRRPANRCGGLGQRWRWQIHGRRASRLASALAEAGARVGLLDADFYGPNIPQMLGSTGRPVLGNNGLLPIKTRGLQVMSFAYLLEPGRPVIWRGPACNRGRRANRTRLPRTRRKSRGAGKHPAVCDRGNVTALR